MNTEQLVRDVETQFTHHPNLGAVSLTEQECQLLGFPMQWLDKTGIDRACFFQINLTGLCHQPSDRFPYSKQQDDPTRGYLATRPPKPEGEVYRRFDVALEKVISFRTFDFDKDLARFTQWMNNPRVAEFWEQAWTEDKLKEFVENRFSDGFTLPLIGEIDGQPFGYFEVYWAAQDRLAPYYDFQEFDRGIHLLVGDENYRGKQYFDAWLRALCHYVFLDDVRTQRIVMEPRFDNVKLFKRLASSAFEKQFEFNFPHKRSALMMMKRELFFDLAWSMDSERA